MWYQKQDVYLRRIEKKGGGNAEVWGKGKEVQPNAVHLLCNCICVNKAVHPIYIAHMLITTFDNESHFEPWHIFV